MKLIARTRVAGLGLAGVAAHAQDAAKVEPLHFHHVHLNSIDPEGRGGVLPEAVRAVGDEDDVQRLRGGEDRQRLHPVHEGRAPPQNELTGPQTSVWHFGWNTPELAQVQREVPRDGADDRADVGRGRRQARGHVERHAAGPADAGADPRDARQG